MERFEFPGGEFSYESASSPTVVSDGRNAYAHLADGISGGQALLSLDPDGGLRWISMHDGGGSRSWPVAALEDRLYVFWYSGLDPSNGTAVLGSADGEAVRAPFRQLAIPEVGGYPTHIGAGMWLDQDERVWSTGKPPLTLYQRDQTRWSLDKVGAAGSPILTASRTALLPGRDSTAQHLAVAEVNASSRVVRSCLLHSSSWTPGPFVLHDGTFVAPNIEDSKVVGVSAWWIPGLTEAEHGWTSPGGGPGRGGAPH